ncbi:MAG: hypothetical protein ABL918_09015 [Chakrabartia sp.]
MPLTLTLTEGVLPAGDEKVAFQRLGNAMLKWHGLSGNAAMTRNVVGTLHVLPQGHAFAGMEATPAAFIEWKVPSFAFTDPAVQKGYFTEATDIIHELSGGKFPRDKVFINVVHAVDGAWNFDGEPMTNDEIGAAITAG